MQNAVLRKLTSSPNYIAMVAAIACIIFSYTRSLYEYQVLKNTIFEELMNYFPVIKSSLELYMDYPPENLMFMKDFYLVNLVFILTLEIFLLVNLKKIFKVYIEITLADIKINKNIKASFLNKFPIWMGFLSIGMIYFFIIGTFDVSTFNMTLPNRILLDRGALYVQIFFIIGHFLFLIYCVLFLIIRNELKRTK